MNYILDSCALISYIMGESEATKVKDLLASNNNSFYLNYINYGEVIFTLEKKGLDKKSLEEVKSILKEFLDIKFLKVGSFEMVEMAAELKIRGGLSYFDALILASSKKYELTIITKDSEFNKFRKDFQILFL
jgi:predicted nucleic acid-binding protein